MPFAFLSQYPFGDAGTKAVQLGLDSEPSVCFSLASVLLLS